MLWSNALAYHDVLLAPRDRLVELQDIDERVADRAPTLFNEYEIYGDRHFLREGDPAGPAEYRPALLALLDGTLLTKAAWADLDSFPLGDPGRYPSIVTRRSPPKAARRRTTAWYGRATTTTSGSAAKIPRRSLAHIPLGESHLPALLWRSTERRIRAGLLDQPRGDSRVRPGT